MRPRRIPWVPILILLFIGMPILEIYVIIQVGQAIGPWWTILLLIADSVFGSWLLRREGARAWTALRIALSEGRMPTKELADGILIVLGGTLMISPGFVTDAFGLFAILPVTRPLSRRLLTRVISRRLIVTSSPPRPSRPRNGPGNGHRPGPDVVQGDVVDPQ